jgi:hypothetical protein
MAKLGSGEESGITILNLVCKSSPSGTNFVGRKERKERKGSNYK